MLKKTILPLRPQRIRGNRIVYRTSTEKEAQKADTMAKFQAEIDRIKKI